MRPSTLAAVLAASVPVVGPLTWWATGLVWGFVIPAVAAVLLILADREGAVDPLPGVRWWDEVDR